MTPLVSIIIPAYKAEKFIQKTINSVLNQSFQNFEVIVIDDGSPDNQKKVIEKVAKTDERIKYIYQKNAGVSEARNHGFRLSKGEYLAFLDADDIWLPNNLNLKINKFQEDNFGLVHSDTQIIDENDIPQQSFKKGKEGYILDDLLSWNGNCIPAPSSILVKREVLEKCGLFHNKLSNSADQEFFFRVASKYKIGRVDTVTWYYRVHNNQMHSNIKVMEKDLLLTYSLAYQNKLFRSRKFEKECLSKMYMILGKSWIGHNKNYLKGITYLLRSFLNSSKTFYKNL